jgi:hypothetical protein
MSQSNLAPFYWVPIHTVDVSLNEFDIDEIAEFLRHKGHSVDGVGASDINDEVVIDRDDLNRIETLTLCGQRDQAREFALSLISARIGRPL